jgi:TonB family protein
LIVLRCVYALVAGVALRVDAQSHAETGTGSSSPIPLETFEEPCIKSRSPGYYPLDEIRTLGEGWVNLSLMVDSKGKPYEIAVTDSTGNRDFERAAVAAVSQWTYQPGSVNGQPIDSATQLTFRFVLAEIPPGVHPAFHWLYRAAMIAIKANDRTAADVAMKKLEIGNLTEDAYYGLLKYNYARVWGDDIEQLAGVRRAIASGDARDYLSEGVYANALRDCLYLELKIHDYVQALKTWDRVQKLHDRDDARMKPVIADLENLRTDDRAYDVSGVLSDESWNLNLFKRHFRIAVSDGYIAQVKLLCKKRYVSFEFDPKVQYSVDDAWGDCALRLEGGSGTHFTLSQS